MVDSTKSDRLASGSNVSVAAESAFTASGGRAYDWPGKARFALSIMDDTDNATLRGVKPFYDALKRYGIRTTKTVWALPNVEGDRFTGESLSDAEYREWTRELAADGFEIAWHGARSGGTERALHDHALQFFKSELGSWPRTYANHAQNRECIYWGHTRFDTKLLRTLYGELRSGGVGFIGDKKDTPYYWGDLCRDRISYVRGFTFRDILTTQADPWMPYHDATRPDVRTWFSGSDGDDVDAFVRLLSPANLDRLERSGGACVVYTHIASGFVKDGRVDARVERILADLSSRPGWYVPVATLLDHMTSRRGIYELRPHEHRALERRWALDRVGPALSVLRRRFARLCKSFVPTRNGRRPISS